MDQIIRNFSIYAHVKHRLHSSDTTVTITLAMICFDLRLKSKTVLMIWDNFYPKIFVCYFKGE